jgi:type IV pilus modification protein PilV
MEIKIVMNQKGFSLVETLIAVVVLTVGLLAVSLLQIGAMKGNSNAIGRTMGVSIAQSYMDDLKSRSLDDPFLVDNGDNGDNLDDGQASGGAAPVPGSADHSAGQVKADDGGVYTVFWNVADDVPVNGSKTVRVFVYWNDQRFGLSRVIVTSVLGGLL